jgi:putative DNA primase/helicase
LAGAPGTGKTTIATQLAACVSAGRALPSGFCPESGRVLVWSGEDDPADTLVPRLIAAGAHLPRVHFIGDVRENGEQRSFDPARDVPKLAAAVAGMDDLALIVIDPLVSAVSGDSHKNAEVRRGLAPLVELAANIGAALFGITHYSKSTQGRDPLERVSGSLAFGALARVVLGTVKQETEEGQPQRMMLARAKSNIGPDGDGFAYVIEQTELQGGITTSRIAWGEAVEGAARDLLAEASVDGGASEARDAASWLRDLLTSGPLPTAAIRKKGGDAGFSERSLQRAMRKIGAYSKRSGFGLAATWELPGATRASVDLLPGFGPDGANDATVAFEGDL